MLSNKFGKLLLCSMTLTNTGKCILPEPLHFLTCKQLIRKEQYIHKWKTSATYWRAELGIRTVRYINVRSASLEICQSASRWVFPTEISKRKCIIPMLRYNILNSTSLRRATLHTTIRDEINLRIMSEPPIFQGLFPRLGVKQTRGHTGILESSHTFDSRGSNLLEIDWLSAFRTIVNRV